MGIAFCSVKRAKIEKWSPLFRSWSLKRWVDPWDLGAFSYVFRLLTYPFLFASVLEVYYVLACAYVLW